MTALLIPKGTLLVYKTLLGTVTHTCNPSYVGSRDGSWFKASLGKVSETPVSLNKLCIMVVCFRHPRYAGGLSQPQAKTLDTTNSGSNLLLWRQRSGGL
jgi:hypothetical protein